MNKLKRVVIFQIISLLIFNTLFLFISPGKEVKAAQSTTLQKTVEFLVGQDQTVRLNGDQVNFPFTISIPETPTILSAFIEIQGISYSLFGWGTQSLNVDLQEDNNPPGAGTDYILGSSGRARYFKINHNVLDLLQNITTSGDYSYTLYLQGNLSGGLLALFSIYSAKLVLTYEYSFNEPVLLKTKKIFIGQKNSPTPPGTTLEKTFSLEISENNPQIKSVFVETEGNLWGLGWGSIDLSLVKEGNSPNYTTYNIIFNLLGSSTRFRILHDASEVILSSDFPGTQNYTLSYQTTTFTTSLLKSWLIITYTYSPFIGYAPVGYLISSIFDTQVNEGVAFNTISWQGSLPVGSKVRFQVASSNNPDGPWTFTGPDGTENTFYEPSGPDQSIEIDLTLHNNKRYLRYKIFLYSTPDRQQTPEVQDIILNWSP